MNRMKNKVAFVTGGSLGIGRAAHFSTFWECMAWRGKACKPLKKNLPKRLNQKSGHVDPIGRMENRVTGDHMPRPRCEKIVIGIARENGMNAYTDRGGKSYFF